MGPQPATARSRVGRPSVATDRRRQAVSAFVDLIAERGLEGVTLDDVANAAGMQRSVVRHYVGNRTDLMRAAVEILTSRYAESIRSAIGDEPTAEHWLDLMFSRTWVSGMQNEDRALDVLLQEAMRDPVMRDRIKAMYDSLVEELARLLRAEHPGTTPTAARQLAYQIVCLAEHGVTMQQIGFAPELAGAARRQAARLVDELG